MYRNFFKQIFDFFFALALLIVLAPIIVILTLILLFANKGKPFFLQPRPGKNGEIFNIIKFRTMRDAKSSSEASNSSIRITPIGNLVRKYSLDELLQLVNVLKGDMSIIGPRPLLVSYLPLYNEKQKKRHDVKPGITGWAQINGRNSINWNQKFELDIWYVEHISIALDLRILFRTFIKVVRRTDVNRGIDVTMPIWQGNHSTP